MASAVGARYSEADLLEAKRQIDSILHKLRETIRTLAEKENADRLRSQMTLASRRIDALEIADALIGEALGQRIWRLADHPDMAFEAAQWFSSKWGIPTDAYLESIHEGICHADTVPQWYIVRAGDAASGRIIAGCGIIENDFHDRTDLAPNLCALFVEEEHRSRGLARALVAHAAEEAHRLGRSDLFLITDHCDLYERYGWEYHGNAKDDDGRDVRVYRAPHP